MWGGINKVMRNIVAGAQDSEFEKVCSRSASTVTSLLSATDESHIPLGQQRAQGKTCDL